MKQFYQIVTEELSPSSCLQIQISKAQSSPGALSVPAGRQSKGRRSELVCARWGSRAQRASSGHGCLALLCPCWMGAAEPTPQQKHCTTTVFEHRLHHVLELSTACSQPELLMTFFQLPSHPNIPLKTTTVPIHPAVTQFLFMTHFFYQDPVKKQAQKPPSLM